MMATRAAVILEAERMPEEDEVEGLPEVEVQPVLEGEDEEGVGHTAEVARHSPHLQLAASR